MEKKEYEEHIGGMMGYYLTTLSLQAGQRLGLIKHLLDDTSPMTSHELAEKASLKERYVREWLGNMVSARIVTMQTNGGDRRYSIPTDHHASIKTMCAYLPMLLHFRDRIDAAVDCFKADGPYGYGYDKFGKYVDCWNTYRDDTTEDWVGQQVEHYKIIGLEDKLEKGILVLDMGCGTGSHVISFATRYPNSTFVGVDNDALMYETAKRNVIAAGLSNSTFQTSDMCNMDEEFTERFDMVLAVQTIHNLPNPKQALMEARRVLKPDGVFSMIEPLIHANHEDNVGNMTSATYNGLSLFECLPCSMSEEPHVGYGGGWGMENLEKTLTEIPLQIDFRLHVDRIPALHYVCSKAIRD